MVLERDEIEPGIVRHYGEFHCAHDRSCDRCDGGPESQIVPVSVVFPSWLLGILVPVP